MKKKKKTATEALSVLLVLMLILTGSNTVMAQETNDKPESAESAQSLKLKADAAYSKGMYQESIADYEAALKMGKSANLYYNLGNAYYRTENITRAVINYEKALLLAPGDADILHNLEIARAKTIDNIQPQEKIFFKVWIENFKTSLGVDAWATIALISLIVSLLLFLVYLFAKQMAVRKAAFYASVVLVFVFIVGNIFASDLKKLATNPSCAIISSPAVTAKKTPTSGANDVCVLHEGTRVDILDNSLKGWLEIRIADGREGWIEDKSVELIR